METGASLYKAETTAGKYIRIAAIAVSVLALLGGSALGFMKLTNHDTKASSTKDGVGLATSTSTTSTTAAISAGTSSTTATTATTTPPTTVAPLSARPTTLVAATADGLLVQLNSKTGKVDHVIINNQQLSDKIDSLGIKSTYDYCSNNPIQATLQWSQPNYDAVNKKVYFLTTGSCVDGSVVSIDLDGNNLRLIKKDVNVFALNAKATQIVYSYSDYSIESDTSTDATIVRNLSDGKEHTLYSSSSNTLTWSSDGSQIAADASYCGEDSYQCDSDLRIYTASKTYAKVTDGQAVKFDRNFVDTISSPSFLPNGDLVVVRSLRGDDNGINDVSEINPTTGSVVRTLARSAKDESYSDTAVDKTGQHVLFTSYTYSGDDEQYESITRSRVVDGTNKSNVMAENIESADW